MLLMGVDLVPTLEVAKLMGTESETPKIGRQLPLAAPTFQGSTPVVMLQLITHEQYILYLYTVHGVCLLVANCV